MSKKTKNLRKQRRRELSEFEKVANRAAKMTYLAERTLGVVDKGSPMANYLDEMAADKAEYQKDPDAYRKKYDAGIFREKNVGSSDAKLNAKEKLYSC